MINCAQLLTIVFLIGVIDNLPSFFKRAEKKIKSKDDDDEFEWVQVKKKRVK